MNKLFLNLLIFVVGCNLHAMEKPEKAASFKAMATLEDLPIELKLIAAMHFLNPSLKKGLRDFCKFAMASKGCYQLYKKENIQTLVSLHSERYFLTLDSDLEIPEKDYEGQLFLNKKDDSYMRFLLKNGIAPHEIIFQSGDIGITYLSLILQSYNSSLLDILHHNEYDFTEGVKKSNAVAILAGCIIEGREDFLKKLIEYGCDVNIHDEDIGTVLSTALMLKKAELVHYLLEQGARLNAEIENCPPLYACMKNGDIETMELLLKKGADVNCAFGDQKTTCLMLCLEHFKEQKTIVSKLPCIKNFFNNLTALEITKLLLRFNADSNLATIEGYTSLMLASEKGYNLVINELLNAGALINTTDNDGNSALCVACFGNLKTVQLLLERGADPNVRNQQGFTPLAYAQQEGKKTLESLLKKYGAQ
jgi:ankyrin repeat protein